MWENYVKQTYFIAEYFYVGFQNMTPKKTMTNKAIIDFSIWRFHLAFASELNFVSKIKTFKRKWNNV